jgi:nucleotide-binding universal stress UspA family protein
LLENAIKPCVVQALRAIDLSYADWMVSVHYRAEPRDGDPARSRGRAAWRPAGISLLSAGDSRPQAEVSTSSMADTNPPILVPVDFSEPSQRALCYAIPLAKQLEVELHLLHAWRLPAWWTDVEDGGEGLGDPEMVRLWASRGLASWCEEVERAGLRCQTDLVEGRPSAAIAARAAELGAQLVVLSAQGSAALRHALLGSVAERVIRLAPCPVLTVPAGSEPRNDGRLRCMLVGTDFSSHARRALEFACRLGERLGRPRLVLAHAYHVPVELASTLDQSVLEAAEPIEDRGLQALSDELRSRGWSVRTRLLRERPPDRALAELAQVEGADLLVIGARGRSDLSVHVLGSVTDRVIRAAPCPVVTVGTGETLR